MNPPDDPPDSADDDIVSNRALVVEDNLVNQTMISAILNSLDFEVIIAENGEKAIEAVRQEQFDIILMDIHMPVMDGFSATRNIRDLGGWCASVPIIAVTANEMAQDQATYVAAGLDDVIPKPIDTRNFAETILRHLSNAVD